MKYFLIFFLLFNFSYLKNLSAYYKVSIKNLDDSLNQDYFSNRLFSDLTSSNQNIGDFDKYFKNLPQILSVRFHIFVISINLQICNRLQLLENKFDENIDEVSSEIDSHFNFFDD